MRYLGSKTSVVEQVHTLISDRVGSGSFCDPFGGIGIVGAHFKRKGYSVWSGDVLNHAHYFQVARIQRQRAASFARLLRNRRLDSVPEVIRLLNNASERRDWFVREYAEKRRFFTLANARRIAGCRRLIHEWDQEDLLTF